MARSPFSVEPITVYVNGSPIPVPHRTAAVWVDAMHRRNGPGGMLLELCREKTADVLREALITGDITAEQVVAASQDLMQQAIPYKWWESSRLLLLSASTDVLGRTVVKGIDPWDLTAAQWCTGIYTLCTEHADEQGKFKFDAMLATPPAGIEDDDFGDDSFDAMVAQARRMPGMG